MLPQDKSQLLQDALTKARHLLADIRKQQLELLSHPESLPASQLEEGRAALESAAQAALRTVRALESIVPPPP